MRHIETNFARCHPIPEPVSSTLNRPTTTMIRGYVEAAATGLITDQLQPNPDHPHVAARIRKVRSTNPVPLADNDSENTADNSTHEGTEDRDSST